MSTKAEDERTREVERVIAARAYTKDRARYVIFSDGFVSGWQAHALQEEAIPVPDASVKLESVPGWWAANRDERDERLGPSYWDRHAAWHARDADLATLQREWAEMRRNMITLKTAKEQADLARAHADVRMTEMKLEAEHAARLIREALLQIE